MRFRSEIEAKNITLSNFPMEMAETIDGEPEMVHGDAIVSWEIEFETREWGIKDILVHVLFIEIGIGDKEVLIRAHDMATIDNVNDDTWQLIETRGCISGNDIRACIYPIEIILDWEKKTAHIDFY